mgnify:CR=1 FL=1
MSYSRPDWDLNAMRHWIQLMGYEASNSRNDGWTASGYKKELFKIKCLIEDVYTDLPTFVGEENWEQERLIEILKKK